MVPATIPRLPQICKDCETVFVPKNRRGPSSAYCSPRCRDRLRYTLTYIKTHLCKYCGEVFTSRYKNTSFCSCRCRNKFYAAQEQARNSAHPKGTIKQRACEQCHGVVPMVVNQKICEHCLRTNKRSIDKRRRAIKRSSATYDRFTDLEIFERDGWRCQHCHTKVSRQCHRFHPSYPHLDHIIPLSKGGTHTRANVQCLCHFCNIIKGNRAKQDQLRLF